MKNLKLFEEFKKNINEDKFGDSWRNTRYDNMTQRQKQKFWNDKISKIKEAKTLEDVIQAYSPENPLVITQKEVNKKYGGLGKFKKHLIDEIKKSSGYKGAFAFNDDKKFEAKKNENEFGEYEPYLTDELKDTIRTIKNDKDFPYKERKRMTDRLMKKAKENREMNKRSKEQEEKVDPELRQKIKDVWQKMEDIPKTFSGLPEKSHQKEWSKLYKEYSELMKKLYQQKDQ